ncbi:hypothetical protein NBRC110019_28280 [Neptunitalea chrysea]|uniref:Uncharacterized protein n=1 Tax=Neptunitalea chrysea TaxID=1647581 RepID=A0A9W6B8S5_9FLAO|nr:hypothetical protein [Neptunitalea chrysea]GLB53787.1 hypothetical protein NBRC110019_28280 [Neptunitalea chrysea]
MTILAIAVYLLLGLFGLVLIVMVGIKLLVHLLDKRAIGMVKEYSEIHGFVFEKVLVYPNHYMLFVSKNMVTYTACFTIGDVENIIWNGASPVDQLRKKEEVDSKNLTTTNVKKRMSAV